MDDRIELAIRLYEAFARGDRDFTERHLAPEFTFSAPPDPMLDRDAYFERCWPGAGRGQTFDFKRAFVHGDEVVLTYELRSADGRVGRNTEILTIVGDQVRRAEVYFGWTVSEPAAD